MFKEIKAKLRKKRILKQAFKKAGEPIWWVFYETPYEANNTVKVAAPTEAEAKLKAYEKIWESGESEFHIKGTAAI